VQFLSFPLCYIGSPAFPALTTIATSQSLGVAIANAIGLPLKNLAGFSLHFEPERAVACHAKYYVDADDGFLLPQIMESKFDLVEQ
jgi:hypothetical protein